MSEDEPTTAIRYADRVAQGSPDWAHKLSLDAAAVTPWLGRAATSAERLAAARAWLGLSDDPRMIETPVEWRVSVDAQALSSTIFCFEMDKLDDAAALHVAAAGLAERITQDCVRLDRGNTRAHAQNTVALFHNMMVEMSISDDPVAALLAGMRAVTDSLGVETGETPLEGLARRHHTRAAIARKLVHAGQGTQWMDVSIEEDRLATGLDPQTDDIPDRSEAQQLAPYAPPLELSVRWQGLSIGYRVRGAANGSAGDLERAVQCADVALSLLPLGDLSRGGALMARGGALLSLGEFVDTPYEQVKAAADAYRMAVELPGSGAAKRQKRLTSLGNALRRLHELSLPDPGYRGEFLNQAIREHGAALRVSPLNGRERPRLLANLANCLYDRARALERRAGAKVAIRLYRQALDLSLAQDDGRSRDVQQHQLLLATALERWSRPADALDSEAERLFSDALSRSAELDVALYVRAARRFAALLKRYGRVPDAVETLLRSARRLSGSSDPRSVATGDELVYDAANLLASSGDTHGALELVGAPATGAAAVLLPGANDGVLLTTAADGTWRVASAAGLTWTQLRRAREFLQRGYRGGDDDRPQAGDVEDAVDTAIRLWGGIADEPVAQLVTGSLRIQMPGVAMDLPVSSPFATRPGGVLVSTGTHREGTRSPAGPAVGVGILVAEDQRLVGARAELTVLRRLLKGDLVEYGKTSIDADPSRAVAVLQIAAHGDEIDGRPALRLAESTVVTLDELLAGVAVPPAVVLTVCPIAYRSHLPAPPQRFAQYFLEAGAEVVVAPLWPVRDATSAALSAGFHQHLMRVPGGRSPADSAAAALALAVHDLRTLTTQQWRTNHPELAVLAPLRASVASPEALFRHPSDWAPWTCWT